ncbi:RagB/SusD family nutrient uptake outer membrane protein [Chitinophaga sp.]|uniref:RagB/SusD family nutrient uptake outer membrane protein n=1 Tax=Chitinophaga sp. TaxID=1869181 RepID=UPI0031E1E8A1
MGGPGSKVEATITYEDDMTAMMSLYHIYGAMFGQDASPAKLARFTGLYSDELELAWDDNAWELYWNKISPNNLYITNLWNACYSYIRDANDVYWGCYNSGSLDTVIRKQLMAEALFIRAYWYFYLVNLFGDIPVPTTTDAKVNALLSRAPMSEVYQQIISDLLAAQKDLGDEYVGTDSKTISNERTRPNKATVSALLARVYLYLGRYEEAEQQASAIIAMNETYTLVPLDQVFLKNSKEAIWQLMASTPNVSKINTTEGNEFILNQPPKNGKQQAISRSLFRSFENSDQRKKHWIGSYIDRSASPSAVTYYYPYKFKISFGEDLQEYSMIFRLAEIYLVRAECSAHLGKLSEALADLNKIKHRAGLPAMPGGNLDKDALINAILKERQVELFTEQCHYWFDLKRTGNVNSVMATVTADRGGESWNATKQLWPIPAEEIKRAPNLLQNEGY